MLRPLALLSVLLLFSGCVAMNVPPPPEVNTETSEDYRGEPMEGGLLAIAPLGSVTVLDEGGVQAHLQANLQPQENVGAFYRDFVTGRLVDAVDRKARFGESVTAVPAAFEAARDAVAGEPAEGVVLAFDGIDPDYVLFMDSLSVYRSARLATTMMPATPANPAGGTSTHRQATLRHRVRFVLWDNRAGRTITSGYVEDETGIPFRSYLMYENGVDELVEAMMEETPFGK